MSKTIVIEKFGGSDVLQYKNIALAKPKDYEVLIRHEAIGINFLDILFRKGQYEVDLPLTPGCEACGIVEAIGAKVTEFKVGDRVAYATMPHGAYAESRLIDYRYVVPVPKELSAKQVVAVLLKGMTAHYLLRRTFLATEKNSILIHASAGGVGQFLCQLALHYKVKVIATVGSDEKKAKVEKLGVKNVVNYEKEDFIKFVMDHTNGQGVHIVYDSVGGKFFDNSIKCLSDFGMIVHFGDAPGKVPTLDIKQFREKSLFFTAPNIFTYKKDRRELLLSMNEVFALTKQKILVPDIYQEYSFDHIKEAHDNMEARKTSGQSVVVL